MEAVLSSIKPIFAARDDADASLIARCRSGERAAFGILLDRYRDRIINLAYQVLRDRDDAEDVAQEVFTKAFTSLYTFRAEAQFFTWLYCITLNICLERKRRARHCESYDEQEQPDSLSGDSAAQALTKIHVERTLDRLSEPLRLTLVLHEMHELSYEEVAAVLGIPIGTVRSRLSDARRKFREAWETS